MEKEVKTALRPPQKIRGRFAPTPSGRMHLGNLLCGLLAWLSVHSQGGEMVLRIEDLDGERCLADYVDLLREDLLMGGAYLGGRVRNRRAAFALLPEPTYRILSFLLLPPGKNGADLSLFLQPGRTACGASAPFVRRAGDLFRLLPETDF